MESAQFRSINRRQFIRLTAVPLVVSSALAIANPALAATYQPWWVQNNRETQLWSGPTDPAVAYGVAPQWSYLQVVLPQSGPRLYVWVPWTKNYAYVDAKDVGPSGAPPKGWADALDANGEPRTDSVNWVGRVIANQATIREKPSGGAKVLRTASAGSLVQVTGWVAGDALNYDDGTWGQVPEGGFVYSGALQIVPPQTPPAPPADHPAGKWIDVNLLHQTVVAYEDNTPVHQAIGSSGRPGWETPVGLHSIWRRVADETMDSTTLTSLGLDAAQLSQAHYKLQHVLDTQYFDSFGDALHDNYWLSPDRFGTPHSHGCVGLRLADASWFWNWASAGTPVLVRAH